MSRLFSRTATGVKTLQVSAGLTTCVATVSWTGKSGFSLYIRNNNQSNMLGSMVNLIILTCLIAW
jgi:hypothetical protein